MKSTGYGRLHLLILGSVAFWVGLIAASGARAETSDSALIWVDHVGGGNAALSTFSARLHAIVVGNHLREDYGAIDYLMGVRATPGAVLADLRARTARGTVDLFMVAPTDATGAIELEGGRLDAAQIQSLGKIKNLRLVYLGGADTDRLLPVFRAAGAQAVVARKGTEGFSEIFATRFIRRWGEGKTVQECVSDADSQTRAVSRKSGSYLAKRGVGQILYEGLDVNRRGQSSGDISGATASISPPAGPSFVHQGFSDLAIRASGALLTGADLAPENVPDANALIRGAQGVAWDHLGDVFPPSADGLPSVDPENPTPNEVWIDGSAAKNLLGSFATWGGGFASTILDRLDGVRVTRGADDVAIAAYFAAPFTAQFKDPATVKNFAVYGVRLPKTVRFKLSFNDGVATISDLDDGTNGHVDTLALEVKIPVASNEVYLRSLTLDLTTGTAEVNAGVLGDVLTLKANAQIRTKALSIEIWKSIESNLDLLTWPIFVFSRD